jgi:hypothetical protein
MKNSVNLTKELDNLNIYHNIQFCPFDFTNMCKNILKQDTINTVKVILQNEQHPEL